MLFYITNTNPFPKKGIHEKENYNMIDYEFDENDAFDLTMSALDSFFKEAQPVLLAKYPTVNDLPMGLYKKLSVAMSDALITYEQGKIKRIKEKNEHRAIPRSTFHPKLREFIINQSFLMNREYPDFPASIKNFEEEEY